MNVIDQELVDVAFRKLSIMEAVDLLMEHSRTEIGDEINHRIRIEKVMYSIKDIGIIAFDTTAEGVPYNSEGIWRFINK
jgi:hypothetical protein